MKFKYLLLSLVLVLVSSCDNDDYELVQVATPQLMSKSDFRKSVEITPAKSIKEAGKIYAYKNYIFVNDLNKGIHVIDNSNPENPIAIKYINIPGNEDISVKDDYLYADSAIDLLVFDLSDINNISLVERLEDVFDVYNYNIPIEAQETDFNNVNFETDIIVGWTLTTEKREKNDDMVVDSVVLDFAESATGTGGSLARFQIVDKYLYTVGSSYMTIFNIQNLSEPVLANTQYSGWNIETMFQADGYLYLGSTNGMYIYSLTNPSLPELISEFTHWEGCDPVVVDGDFAYLTLRGGNLCGQQESVLEVIDISDKTNPTLQKQYTLDNPYGLGIKGNTLFVCDGTSGLKLFDKEDPLNIAMIKQFKNIQSKDVIPLEDTLLMIGNNTLYQFVYVENGVKQISAYSLN
ncbi:LVIVD repeat-containing protein [Thalassobellus citreus]|uniref:LVIVD repeat-containing protein n=1 Tax=Thalassobellus citreus TaxID=3367752 RepID=UPI0037ADDDF0